MTTLRTWRTIQPQPLNCPPAHSLKLPLLLKLSVVGSIKGNIPPVLFVRCRLRSNRLSALFVETVEQELETMSDSNSISSSALPTYTEIVVVRHGETEWNAGRKIQGHIDVDLNEAGRQQAASVAERLSNEPKISAVYSSDLKRAFDTAQAIANRCGGLEVIKELGLRERHLGDLQGLALSEASKVCPQAYEAFLSHDSSQDIPVCTCITVLLTVSDSFSTWLNTASPKHGVYI
ncbi:Phosphoglycerate mutase-like protein 4 [Linum grandiflorum]